MTYFGYGGANAHAILEAHLSSEAKAAAFANKTATPRAFELSGKDATATNNMKTDLASYLRTREDVNGGLDLESLAYALTERRSHFCGGLLFLRAVLLNSLHSWRKRGSSLFSPADRHALASSSTAKERSGPGWAKN